MGAATTRQRHRPEKSLDQREESLTGFRGTSGEEAAFAIVDGVHAWKALTRGEGPLWQRFNREKKEQDSRRQSLQDGKPNSGKAGLPEGHPLVDSNDPDRTRCPFDSLAQIGEQRNSNTPGSILQRPESLPTPPPTQDHYVRNHVPHSSQNSCMSPPPSIPESSSRCPIRMLDERSPEEVAEYFETHKHEIPRSHEICVKRYQSNEHSIRQLDAKYGSLKTMLQGLGMKHQPLLPAKEEDQGFVAMNAQSTKKVQNWAGDIRETHNVEMGHGGDLPNSSVANTEERLGHFDRPLKEIRVGESPSRPWGISVPEAGSFRHRDGSEAAPTPKAAAPNHDVHPKAKENSRGAPMDDKPTVIFNGPVFMGYDSEQAAAMIQRLGWNP